MKYIVTIPPKAKDFDLFLKEFAEAQYKVLTQFEDAGCMHIKFYDPIVDGSREDIDFTIYNYGDVVMTGRINLGR